MTPQTVKRSSWETTRMIIMIIKISLVGVIYWRYSLSVMYGKSLFSEAFCIYKPKINRVNFYRDLTAAGHVLSNDMCSNSVVAYLPRYVSFPRGSPFFQRTLDNNVSKAETKRLRKRNHFLFRTGVPQSKET